MQSSGESSLTLRDGAANRTARDWLEMVCDVPPYTDPFGRDVDTSKIKPKEDKSEKDFVDKSDVRIFVFMKEKPEICEDQQLPDMRPPWDINTNVQLPPKYLRNGNLNPARFRPGSAQFCNHLRGTATVRPFSAPCGYPEYSSWKHPLDMQPYLNVADMRNMRRYSSVTDLKSMESNPLVREKATKLLSARSTMRG